MSVCARTLRALNAARRNAAAASHERTASQQPTQRFFRAVRVGAHYQPHRASSLQLHSVHRRAFYQVHPVAPVCTHPMASTGMSGSSLTAAVTVESATSSVQDGASSQPAAAAAASSSMLSDASIDLAAPVSVTPASVSSVGAIRFEPLSAENLNRISREINWSKDHADTIGGWLEKATIGTAMSAMALQHQSDAAHLQARLGELKKAQLEKLQTLVGATLPPSVKSTKASMSAAIIAVVAAYSTKSPGLAQLVGTFRRRSGTIASHPHEERKASDQTEEEDEESDEERDEAPATPPRASAFASAASAAPRASPRKTKGIRDLSVLAPPTSKPSAARTLSTSSRSNPPPLASNILAALGQLPQEPTESTDASDDGGRRVKSKASKKEKSKRRVRHQVSSSSSETDSDSDGPASRESTRRSKKTKKTKRSHRHRSPTPSSSDSFSSSSSDDERRSSRSSRLMSRREVDDEMEAHGLARPMASEFLRNIYITSGRTSRSVLKAMKAHTWSKTRNEREAHVLARVLDLIREKKIDEAAEVLVRRLAGVQAADSSDDWRLADAIELKFEKQSFLPEHFLAHAIKSVRRMEALEGDSKANKNGRSKGTGNGANSRPHTRERSPSRESPAHPSSRKAQQQSKGQQKGGSRKK